MDPAILLVVVLVLALTAYALLGGADFGAGVWEFNTGLRASPEEREQIHRALGPVWEANHVWLIFALVLAFSAFPLAFAAIVRALWVPLALALAGIVFRGSAFAFRAYSPGRAERKLWEAVFALGSTGAPMALAAAGGALVSGRLAVDAAGQLHASVLTGWISLTSVFAAFFAPGACAYLAAVYLVRESVLEGRRELARLWRRRALRVGVVMGAFAIAGLFVIARDAPVLWTGFRARSWPLVGLSVLGGAGSLAALATWRATAAVVGAATAVAAVVWGAAVASYPMLVPPALSVAAAAAPAHVLRILLASVAVGIVVLLPSLAYLLRLFKTGPHTAVR